MIKAIRPKIELVGGVFDKNKIIADISGMLNSYKIMFMYFGGSIAYNAFSKDLSDIDVNVFVDGFEGYIHTNCGDYDLFIYGKDYALKRQKVDKSMMEYNKIFIDDKCNIDDLLIYLDKDYLNEFNEFKNYDIRKSLIPYLEAVYNYYMFIYLDSETPVKRFYHVIRIRGQLEYFLKTGNYDLSIPLNFKEEMISFKTNCDNSIGQDIYSDKIGKYLSEIKKIKEDLELDTNWNSLNIY